MDSPLVPLPSSLIPSWEFVPTHYSAEDINRIINDINAIQQELLGEGGRDLSLSEIFKRLPTELPKDIVRTLGGIDVDGWDPANEIGRSKDKKKIGEKTNL